METLADPLLQRLAHLVMKDGVGLGGLSADDEGLALGVVWASLPAGLCTAEPGINALVKAALAGPAAWLDADPLELRRRLVDAGWLWRDGFGREYRRVEVDALAAAQRLVAGALTPLAVGAWVATRRDAHLAAREARRRSWFESRDQG